jgi:hypothetical protein
MRRLGMMLIAAAIGALAPATQAGAGVGFRVNGGFAYIRYSDFNAYADFVNERELPALGVGDRLDNIHWIPELEGELLLAPIPALTIGAGAGIVSGKTEFSFRVGEDGAVYGHTVRAYPFGATAYFNVPLPAAPIRPYLFGGAAAVYSRITFDLKLTSGGFTDGLDAELTTWGLELHGGAGLTFPIFTSVSIDLSVAGRWADLSGYEGSATFIGGEVTDVYLAKEKSGVQSFYGPESVENRDEYEEASVDLTGVAVTVGVTVAF